MLQTLIMREFFRPYCEGMKSFCDLPRQLWQKAQTQLDAHTQRPTHIYKSMQFSSKYVISLPDSVLQYSFFFFFLNKKSNEYWKSIREEKKCGIFAYLIICVAIVCLLWFEIPQDHDPRLKSNYKLERKSDRQSVREAGEMTDRGIEKTPWRAEKEVIRLTFKHSVKGSQV